MKSEEIYASYNCDTMHRIQAIFSSIFVMQNRMQTAGEKLQTQISMKQWLLLAMAGINKCGQSDGMFKTEYKKTDIGA